MALLDQATQVHAQLPSVFETLRQGQAPDKFNRQYLKDIGFKSSNHHALIPLLKGLGFLTSDGSPTQRYKDFLDKTKWKSVLAQAVREAYGDIFVIKAKPTKADKELIAGKYKSTFNMPEIQADRAAKTFLSLLELCDEKVLYEEEGSKAKESSSNHQANETTNSEASNKQQGNSAATSHLGLHYNIQIHLPATKDVEVYNAIFKSLKDHLID